MILLNRLHICLNTGLKSPPLFHTLQKKICFDPWWLPKGADVLGDIWTLTTSHTFCWHFLDKSCWTCIDVSSVKYLYVTVQSLATIDKAGT